MSSKRGKRDWRRRGRDQPLRSVVSGTGSFGEVVTGELFPQVQVDFVNGYHADLLYEYTAVTGSISYSDSMAVLSTGATQYGTAYLRSEHAVRYRPGQGTIGRFTALFDTPVVGVSQTAGCFGGAENGLFFGYDYNDSQARFGVCVQAFGVREIRTLTVTVASAGAETVTITLNGTAFNVSTTAGTAAETAQEIAEGTFTGWTAEADGADVHFMNDSVGAKSGAYTISSTGAADGTFAQDAAGAAVEEDWVYQANWNYDSFDGTGPSGANLDWTKGNVFEVKLQYLGFGGIDFLVENPETREFELAHRYEYAGERIKPTLSNPTFHLGAACSGVDVGSDVTMKLGSLGGFVEGPHHVLGPNHGVSADGNLGATSTAPVLSMRNNEVFINNGVARTNLRDIIPQNISCSGSGSNKPLKVEVILNGTLTDPLWTTYDTTHSFASTDTSATAISGGDVLFATGFSSGGGVNDEMQDHDLVVRPGDILSVVLTTTGNAADYVASLTWKEDA